LRSTVEQFFQKTRFKLLSMLLTLFICLYFVQYTIAGCFNSKIQPSSSYFAATVSTTNSFTIELWAKLSPNRCTTPGSCLLFSLASRSLSLSVDESMFVLRAARQTLLSNETIDSGSSSIYNVEAGFHQWFYFTSI
jgi:hypothetical protein